MDAIDTLVTDVRAALDAAFEQGTGMPVVNGLATWTYHQGTGEMLDPAGELVEVGYSGAPWLPATARSPSRWRTGPVADGSYTIEPAQDHERLGPVALPLTPAADNEMYGRSDFWIHGDNAEGDSRRQHGLHHPVAADAGDDRGFGVPRAGGDSLAALCQGG